MNKKSSILFQITIFFSIIFFIINLIIFVQFLLDNHNYKMLNIQRYFNATRIVLESRFEQVDNQEINKKIKHLFLKLSDVDLRELKKLVSEQEDDKFAPIEIFKYNDKKYIHPRPPKFRDRTKKNIEFRPFKKKRPGPIIFIDLLDDNEIRYFWLIVLLSTDILLGWFYYFLYKKLKPLVRLKNEITKFSYGNLDINTKAVGNDEISQVSNEFNNAITKIRELNDSRKLFLRNILHELKTPITKGKLVSDTLEESRRKEILQKAFLRLEYLLGEFVKLEELTSGKTNLVKKEYRVIDLLDQAIDILLIDRDKLEIFSNVTKVNVDFEIFSIALKNLIDNALRYNTNDKVEIFVKEDSLLIKNKGEPLKKNFEYYLTPFSREYESIDKGLGLGLYITNNVILSHGYKLYYSYSGCYHLFKIQFKIDS